MRTKNKIIGAMISSLALALTLIFIPQTGYKRIVSGEGNTYTLTLSASNKFTSAEQSAHAFTRQTALGGSVAFATNEVASRSEAQYFCQLTAGTTSWLRNTDPINGIKSITITHDLKLDPAKYQVCGGYSYGDYSQTILYEPGHSVSDETIKFTFDEPVNYFSVENLFYNAGTYIRTLVVEYSCIHAGPEEVERNNYVATESGSIVAGPDTFPTLYADDWAGKFFYMEYKMEGGTTHSDYVYFGLFNQHDGWQNISGELDIFGDGTVNKGGTTKSLADGWYSLSIEASRLNGGGNDRTYIDLLYINKLVGINKIIIDMNSISFRDAKKEVNSTNSEFIKFDNPIKNWKTCGDKLIIDFEPNEESPSGTKEVMSLVTAENSKVATFTLRVKTHKLQQGNSGTEIPDAVTQKSGNIWEAVIEFSMINCLGTYDGSETVVGISLDEAWCDFITYSITLVKGTKYEKTNVFKMSGTNFKVVNFTDTHANSPSSLSDTSTIVKTINYGMANSNPDIVTFTGDFIHLSSDYSELNILCDYMDSFEVPYFFIFGNHDREYMSASEITKRINESKYGYIDLGPTSLESDGNYSIDIENSSGTLVHSLLMMDTRNKNDIDPSLIHYVENPVQGVRYGSEGGRPTYGDGNWDGIRDAQLDWYEDKVDELNCETTLMCHAPMMEYEAYQTAINNSDAAALAACDPMGHNNMNEACCSSLANYGLFDLIKEHGSTKNVICGHDHGNDFSLMYQGVRLTYSLKTGDGAYWAGADVNGYTTIDISSTGSASVNHIYYNPSI